jgi:large subunit ribosomal protein L13
LHLLKLSLHLHSVFRKDKNLSQLNTVSYKTKSLRKEDVNKEWLIIDAETQVLGRLSSRAASLIRGKHKPSFTPHVDGGDNVIIINAEKVRLTGKKFEEKKYIRYTGYPGGQRVATPKTMFIKTPERVIENAVRGMLPKNRLGRKMFNNLYVYVGTEHPHEAQKPKQIEL